MLLTWLPAPRLLAPLLSRLASASLWIYLTHWVVWPPLLAAGVPRPAVVVACLVAGVAASGAVNRVELAVARLARRRLEACHQRHAGRAPASAAVGGLS